MKRNPLYVFDSGTSPGIFDVPLGSIIQVVDVDGTGPNNRPSMTQLISKSGLHSGSSINQYLSITGTHVELDRYTEFLGDLSDVNLPATITIGDIFKFDGTGWISSPASDIASDIKLGDLDGVPTATPTNNGQRLEYDSVTDGYLFVTPVKEMDSLIDVDAASPIADQILAWDDTINKWKVATLDGGAF